MFYFLNVLLSDFESLVFLEVMYFLTLCLQHLLYFILFYFISFYFILFYFIPFYFILFYFISLRKRRRCDIILASGVFQQHPETLLG